MALFYTRFLSANTWGKYQLQDQLGPNSGAGSIAREHSITNTVFNTAELGKARIIQQILYTLYALVLILWNIFGKNVAQRGDDLVAFWEKHQTNLIFNEARGQKSFLTNCAQK
jgi:hypothetical protein